MLRELFEEPISRHGYWRVGGPAERLVLVEDDEQFGVLSDVALVLGNGSNLLVPDQGLRGTVLRLGGIYRGFELLHAADGGAVARIGAGLLNTAALARANRVALAGLGCLAGVPGTLGGAVAMNAGTALGEIEAVLVAIEGLDAEHRRVRLSRAELSMGYRDGGLPAGFVVTFVEVALRPDYGQEKAQIEAHLARRRATQPLDQPSCGSVFRNPPGDHAGRLIESVGLKGWSAGQAQISPKHANFIVNLGGATATDVMRCIRKAWDTVRAETGVSLVPEVHVVGEWDPELWPLR